MHVLHPPVFSSRQSASRHGSCQLVHWLSLSSISLSEDGWCFRLEADYSICTSYEKRLWPAYFASSVTYFFTLWEEKQTSVIFSVQRKFNRQLLLFSIPWNLSGLLCRYSIPCVVSNNRLKCFQELLAKKLKAIYAFIYLKIEIVHNSTQDWSEKYTQKQKLKFAYPLPNTTQ